MYPVVEEHVRRAMGTGLFESFMVRSFLVCLYTSLNTSDITFIIVFVRLFMAYRGVFKCCLQNNAECLHLNMDEIQANILLSNNTNVVW